MVLSSVTVLSWSSNAMDHGFQKARCNLAAWKKHSAIGYRIAGYLSLSVTYHSLSLYYSDWQVIDDLYLFMAEIMFEGVTAVTNKQGKPLHQKWFSCTYKNNQTYILNISHICKNQSRNSRKTSPVCNMTYRHHTLLVIIDNLLTLLPSLRHETNHCVEGVWRGLGINALLLANNESSSNVGLDSGEWMANDETFAICNRNWDCKPCASTRTHTLYSLLFCCYLAMYVTIEMIW